MALRDQPYFPLYVQDYLTDEKLLVCSAATQGVYIRMLCIFHKSEPYGGILFKQNDKQNANYLSYFVSRFVRLLPFDEQTIQNAVTELLDEKVLKYEDGFLFQSRMVRDNAISEARSKAGKKGGGNPNFVKTKSRTNLQTKRKQNPEYENEYENENDTDNKNEIELKKGAAKKYDFRKSLLEVCPHPELVDEFMKVRKSKKAVNSKIAFDGLIREISKSGKRVDEILALCCEKSWKSFDSDWLNKQNFNRNGNSTTHRQDIGSPNYIPSWRQPIIED